MAQQCVQSNDDDDDDDDDGIACVRKARGHDGSSHGFQAETRQVLDERSTVRRDGGRGETRGDARLSKDIRNRCRLRHPLEMPDRASDTSQVRRQLAPIVAIYFSKKRNVGKRDESRGYRRKGPFRNGCSSITIKIDKRTDVKRSGRYTYKVHTKEKEEQREEREKGSAREKRIECYVMLHEINFVRFNKKNSISPSGPSI